MRSYVALKRLADVVVSASILWAAAPLLIATALVVELTSPGPSVYAGVRRGYLGRAFPCLKFRSMVIDPAVALARHGLSDRGPDGRLLIYENDPRITPVGRMLRACSIDELPQLCNVLVGHMSLIGPRPLAPYMLESFASFGRSRSVVRPGITGLWQIRHRMKNASILDMIEDDMEYVERIGPALDAWILLATIPRVWQIVRAH